MHNFLSLFSYDFVQNAYLVGTIVAIMAAVIGYFVVLRAQAFAGEALSDISFAGATGAAILGISSLVGMFFFTVLAALGMGALGERIRGRDVEIGMILSFALGLGVLFLTIYSQTGTNSTEGLQVLFGSILTLQRSDIWMTLVAGVVILSVVAILFRPLLFASVDPEVAETRGVPVRLLSTVFLILLGITTAVTVLAVGVLLVLALLIAPPAAALRLTKRPFASIPLAVALDVAIIWCGLTIAFIGPGSQLPVGFLVSALAAIIYFVAIPLGKLRAPRRAEPAPHTDCKHKATYISKHHTGSAV